MKYEQKYIISHVHVIANVVCKWQQLDIGRNIIQYLTDYIYVAFRARRSSNDMDYVRVFQHDDSTTLWYEYINSSLNAAYIVSESHQNCFRKWLGAYTAPSHYLNQCLVIVDWTIRNKFQRNFNQTTIFSFTKMHLKISFAEWRPFCLGGDELTEERPQHFLRSRWPFCEMASTK